MPNLIHSLDGASLILLKDQFDKTVKNNENFYSVHDCFAVTADKVYSLLVILRSVYMSLYSENNYLIDFDKSVKTKIKEIYGDDIKFNSEKNKFINKGNSYLIHDIN